MEEKHEIVKLLANDSVLVKEFARLYRALSLNEGNLVLLQNSFRTNTITSYEIFSEIIDQWISRSNGQLSELCEILRKEKFVNVAENLEKRIGGQSIIDKVWFEIGEPTKYFVGRFNELKALERFYKEKELTIVTGMGGVGKTELVKTFAESKRDEANCVLLNGESTLSLTSSIVRLCEFLNINTMVGNRYRDPNELIQDVCTKLKQIIMIIDNVDKSNILLCDILGNHSGVFAVVTSRNLAVIGEAGEQIDLDVLEPEDVQSLIRRSLPDEKSVEDVADLGRLLQNFPLAVQQSIGFIKNQKRLSIKGKAYSIRDYLDYFEKQTPRLLSYKLSSIEHKYKWTTLITWNVSIDKIQSDGEFGQMAIQLLDIISYFDPERIHVDFLQETYQKMYGKHNNCDQGIQLIKENCLVKVEDSLVSIHRLVQEVIRLKLADSGAALLRNLLTGLELENNTKQTIPHVLSIWKHSMKRDELLREFLILPDKIIDELYRLALYYNMYEFATSNVERLKSVFGHDHIQSLAMEGSIALALSLEGKFVDALAVHRQLYERKKTVLGEEDPSTLKTANNMALVLRDLGKNAEALEINSRVFDICKRVLGIEHRWTLTTGNNVASVLERLGKYDEALEMCKQIYDIEKREFGEKDYFFFITLNNFCLFHRRLGRFEEAQELCRQALSSHEGVLDDMHPTRLTTLDILGITLQSLGKYNEAVDLLHKNYEDRKQILGPTHPNTLSSGNNLALLLIDIKKYNEAEEICKDVLAEQTKILGENHPSTLTSRDTLGIVLESLGRHEAALETFVQLLTSKKLVLGEAHPLTLFTGQQMAKVYKSLGRYEDATDILWDVHKHIQLVLSETHPTTISVAKDLVDALAMCQK